MALFINIVVTKIDEVYMDWTPIVLELPKAIPVVVGGVLGITGGIAGQMMAHRLSARREKEKVLRDKAEELVKLLYEHRDWVNFEKNRLVFGSDIPEKPSPL